MSNPVFDLNIWGGKVSQPYLDRATTSGGMSLARTDEPITAPGGAWVVSLSGVRLNTRDRLNAWRAFHLQARGGARKFDVVLCDKRQGPWPVVAGSRVYTPGGIVAELTDAGLLDDTTVAITVAAGGIVLAGMVFSLTGPRWGKRMYGIEEVLTSGGGVYSVIISPGLREDMADASAVDFETPGTVMRVASQSADYAPAVNLLKFAEVGVSFVESFAR